MIATPTPQYKALSYTVIGSFFKFEQKEREGTASMLVFVVGLGMRARGGILTQQTPANTIRKNKRKFDALEKRSGSATSILEHVFKKCFAKHCNRIESDAWTMQQSGNYILAVKCSTSPQPERCIQLILAHHLEAWLSRSFLFNTRSKACINANELASWNADRKTTICKKK